MIRKLLVGAAVLTGVALVAAPEPAKAGGFNVQIYRNGNAYSFGTGRGYGGGYYGGQSFYRGGGGWGQGYGHYHQPHSHWHDTSHWDYHPGEYVPHGNHYHYIPGHYDWHEDGHWDHH